MEKKRGRITPEEFDKLFMSPEFVQKYIKLSDDEKDEFLSSLSPDDLKHYFEQGTAMQRKMQEDLGPKTPVSHRQMQVPKSGGPNPIKMLLPILGPLAAIVAYKFFGIFAMIIVASIALFLFFKIK